MAVWSLKDFEEALDGAVLAGAAVQQVERNIRLEIRQHGRDVTPHVDARDPIAVAVKHIRTGFAGTKGYLSLGRPATHQDCDVLHLAHHLSICAGASSDQVASLSIASRAGLTQAMTEEIPP